MADGSLPRRETIHASCVVIGEAGILIRGEAGAGKSTLAREWVHAASVAGRFARLVSDDRTRLEARHGRLVARPVAAIAGRVEVRGVGIVAMPFEAGALVRLVVELAPEDPPRLPEPEDGQVLLCGVMVPRLRQRTGAPWQSLLALSLLEGVSCARDTVVTV